MYRFLGTRVMNGVLIAALAMLTSVSVLAQQKGATLACRDDNNWYNDKLVGNCEVREQTLAPTGAVAIDGRQNGGIAVKGWDQNQVLVRARVQTGAPTAQEAADLAKQIRIETSGAKIYASGPEHKQNYHWDVSYEVFVPRRSDLSLETHNGGISIAGVNGKIDFNALNGGVVLKKVGGAVKGSTTNGGLVVELSGDRWDGEALDVTTTNGGVVMSIPENYSAKLETGTTNGGLSIDFPMPGQQDQTQDRRGRQSKQLAVNLGSGGPLVRAITTNGGVRIKRTNTEQ